MKYRIIGTTIPAVEIKFDAPGETMYTQSGGMSWMSEGISMSTNTRGGFMKGLGRMFAGESMFMATYRADAPGATIAFASNCTWSGSSDRRGRKRRHDLPERCIPLRTGFCKS